MDVNPSATRAAAQDINIAATWLMGSVNGSLELKGPARVLMVLFTGSTMIIVVLN